MSFRRFGLARRQPYCTLNTKNTIKIFCFQVKDFLQCRFLVTQGKNGVNPYGLTSILTMSGRKFAYKKHGSDNSFHPKLRFRKKAKTAETQWYQRFSMARWKGLEPLTYWFVGATKTYQTFHTTTYSGFYSGYKYYSTTIFPIIPHVPSLCVG